MKSDNSRSSFILEKREAGLHCVAVVASAAFAPRAAEKTNSAAAKTRAEEKRAEATAAVGHHRCHRRHGAAMAVAAMGEGGQARVDEAGKERERRGPVFSTQESLFIWCFSDKK